MDNKNDIAEIQNLPIAELSELLGALTGPELQELRAMEVASDNGGRKGALEAIDAAIAAMSPTTPPVLPSSESRSDVVDGGAAAVPAALQPDWQKPDYTGPLDIEQSQWRLHNIKPVGKVRTK